MAVKGEIVKKATVIADYISRIRNNINSYLEVNSGNRPDVLSSSGLNHIFGTLDKNRPTVSDITDVLIKSDGIVNLFTNYITKYTRGRTLTLIYRTGNDTNGGTITYTETTKGTWKAYMSDTKEAITDDAFATGSTQPPYNTTDLNASTKANNRNVKPGQIIEVTNYTKFFDDMYNAWKNVVDNTAVTIKYTTCHTNCHSSCHGSRSRR